MYFRGNYVNEIVYKEKKKERTENRILKNATKDSKEFRVKFSKFNRLRTTRKPSRDPK